MCYDRLVTDDEVAETSALRNGAMAGFLVLAVLLVEGAPAWVVLVSVAGGVALGTAFHQALLLVGTGALRVPARLRDGDAGPASEPARPGGRV
ncbi:hypothetical protein [Haloarcula sp. JP-L23]|uniref:hypothetical protein n=1 Tax=Haloarcula sp. JP-L23 TaxID=2716717 RepID=UPI00140F4989|nr:hypothetical protein G9465_10315 [Haloarcula sp. JP-L23]